MIQSLVCHYLDGLTEQPVCCRAAACWVASISARRRRTAACSLLLSRQLPPGRMTQSSARSPRLSARGRAAHCRLCRAQRSPVGSKQSVRHTDIHTDRQTDRRKERDRQTDGRTRQAERKTDRQTDGQTDRLTVDLTSSSARVSSGSSTSSSAAGSSAAAASAARLCSKTASGLLPCNQKQPRFKNTTFRRLRDPSHSGA